MMNILDTSVHIEHVYNMAIEQRVIFWSGKDSRIYTQIGPQHSSL